MKYESGYPTATEVHNMVEHALEIMGEEDKRKVLIAHMTGQCIMIPKNFSVQELQTFYDDLTLLYKFYESAAEQESIYASIRDIVGYIMKGIGRMVHAREHDMLSQIDLYDE